MENRMLFGIRTMRRSLTVLVLLVSPAMASAPQSPLDATIVNDRAMAAVVAEGATAESTLRAQILLERANFSPGEIDGSYGTSTRQAIAAFQATRGIEASGRVDAATWDELNAGNMATALVEYTVTEADVAGPFVEVPDEVEEKAKLPALGFSSALEALGEKFHASPGLLRRLNPGATFETAGERILVPNAADVALAGVVAKVVVDESDAGLRLLDAEDKVLARFPASVGSEHDPLPIGDWKITAVVVDPAFHYNPDLFWDADPQNEKARIAPGPNNPVGTVWIDLSKEHYGVHGTPEPSQIGRTESHGCIRLTNWSARIVASAVKPGTSVVLQD